MRAAGLSKDQLAARLHWTSSQVTRPFDGRRAARLDKVEAALAALGHRLVVTSEAALSGSDSRRMKGWDERSQK